MNRIVAIIIVIIVVAAGVGAYIFVNNGPNSSKTNISNQPLGSVTAVDACDVLTESAAKQTLGDKITKASAPATTVNSADISVGTCSYVSSAPGTGTNPKSSGVWLIVRVAKTSAGANSNKAQFLSEKPADVQSVDGLGDSAFYNPQFRQLNVLKGNNWYVITAYKDSILNSSLESNKKLAEKLEFK